MPYLPSIDTAYLINFLVELLNTPSPTGFSSAGIACVERALEANSAAPALTLAHTRKGALLASWSGQKSDHPRALTAHVDTLGAMVKEIKSDGRLKLTQVGGYPWNTIEGEGCTVFASRGKVVRGSILLTKASAHVYGAQVGETKRDGESLEVRLDARTTSPEETRALGIEVGDFIAFDPRVEVTENFVRSRHLDDKACVACLVSAVKSLADAGLQPVQKTFLLFSK